jgi:CubicO group peptidase (beta-lactamase class C family)
MSRAAFVVRRICSGIFLSGRTADDVLNNSGPTREEKHEIVQTGGVIIDRTLRRVTITLEGETRSAQCLGDSGSVLIPRGFDMPRVEPFIVSSSLPPADSLPWPMGDRLPARCPVGVDRERVSHAIRTAFEDPADLTTAVVVVYKGEIIGEMYALGASKDTLQESWSMGKSVLATLFGLAEEKRILNRGEPTGFVEWAHDERREIRLQDLLNMSGGLSFDKQHGDVYRTDEDTYQLVRRAPYARPPRAKGTGEYLNCDPLNVAAALKAALVPLGQTPLGFAQKALFDRIGIRRLVCETDTYGNALFVGLNYGTARDWARLGLLYAQNGLWQGTRLLSEDWIKFVRTPAPQWNYPIYGGLFWVNNPGKTGLRDFSSLPSSTFFAAGPTSSASSILRRNW